MASRNTTSVGSALEALDSVRQPYEKMLGFQAVADKAFGFESLRMTQESLDAITGRGAIASTLEKQGAVAEALTRTLGDDYWAKTAEIAGAGKTAEALQAITGMSDVLEKADLFGSVKLAGGIAEMPELQRTALIGSSLIDADVMGAGKIADQLGQLVGGLKFEVGEMFAGIQPLDASATLFGRETTMQALLGLDTTWRTQFDSFTVADLVAPVIDGEGIEVISAFPPDLVEEQPLQTEFEVDAVVAENQEKAQIFLALRSERAARRMASARERLQEGDTEALSQSMLACRRALHALADDVRPPSTGTVIGRDGVERKVGSPHFKNRLVVLLDEQIPNSTPRKLAVRQLEATVGVLNVLIEELGKGVHADVVRDETTQIYLQTWAFIAQVARLVD